MIPLKNSSLILYSKFDEEVGVNYIRPSKASTEIESSAKLVESFDGPFSIPKSSYSTKYLHDWLVSYSLEQDGLNFNLSSFTLSFFIRVVGNKRVGIYEDSFTSAPRFSVTAVGLDLRLETQQQRWTHLLIKNILKANNWQFIALTYENQTQTLKLYDQTAVVKMEYKDIDFDRSSLHKITIGKSTPFRMSLGYIGSYDNYRDSYFFPPSSAIACFSVHSQALTQMEIALLPCACQFKDQQQPR